MTATDTVHRLKQKKTWFKNLTNQKTVASLSSTYNALVVKRIRCAVDQKPNRPEIFESKLNKEICSEYHHPNQEELRVEKQTEINFLKTIYHSTVSQL